MTLRNWMTCGKKTVHIKAIYWRKEKLEEALEALKEAQSQLVQSENWPRWDRWSLVSHMKSIRH
jgi:hypothetical protein